MQKDIDLRKRENTRRPSRRTSAEKLKQMIKPHPNHLLLVAFLYISRQYGRPQKLRARSRLSNRHSSFKILPLSVNAFLSTDVFLFFMLPDCVIPMFKKPHNSPQFLDILWRKANARNVSFSISLQCSVYLVSSESIKPNINWSKVSCFRKQHNGRQIGLGSPTFRYDVQCVDHTLLSKCNQS